MPIYEYRRPDGTKFEIQQSFSEDALTVDPETGVPVVRVLHAPAVHFKGNGFYSTDYGTRNRERETAANAASSSAKESASKDSSKDSSGKDSSSSTSTSGGSSSSGADTKGSSGDGKRASGSKDASAAKAAKPVPSKS